MPSTEQLKEPLEDKAFDKRHSKLAVEEKRIVRYFRSSDTFPVLLYTRSDDLSVFRRDRQRQSVERRRLEARFASQSHGSTDAHGAHDAMPPLDFSRL